MAADLYPNINFPSVDFSWLGNLPKVSEEARKERLRQSLGDLNTSSPEGLEAASKKLIAGGDIETGLRVQNAALALREHLRKKEEGLQYLKALPAALAANRAAYPGAAAAAAPPGTAGAGVSYLGTPTPGAPEAPAAPPAPDLFNAPANQPGALESVVPGLGPRSEAPPESPSDAIITAAQQGQNAPAPPVPQPQFAQAGGAGGPSVPIPAPAAPAPPPALPSWLQGARSPAVPAPPPAATPVPASGPRGPAPTVPSNPEIEQKLFALGDAMSRMPPHAVAQRQAIAKTYEDLLRQVQLGPEDRAWQMNNLDRWKRGAQPLSREDYILMNQVAPKVHEEAVAASKIYEDEAVGSRRLGDNLKVLDTIVNNPKFVSGKGTEEFTHAASMLNGLKSLAVSLGVPENQLPDTTKITEPARLQEAFRSISNLAVINRLGGLGRQISDSDRNYMGAAFPSLSTSVAGNKVIVEMMTAMAERNQEIGRLVRDYRREHGARIEAPEIHALVDRYSQEHSLVKNPDGSFTELGKKLTMAMQAPPVPTGPRVVPVPGVGPGGSGFNFPANLGGFRDTVHDYLGLRSNPPPANPEAYDETRTDTRARGGPVTAGRPYTVGEKGPETFVPQTAGVILPHHEGKVFFHTASGRPAGRIRGGKPVFFGRR